ncbi:hypothetical protein EAL2_808p04490 (plasmid) [Peptoclostridium acidaminophilum DSM 3953]|uniref:Uncharacterized protein n=1 Tax=Peptoclostridium acidaminophilum DSM 3953 TaxID=1286171 RepID=W8T2X8_PEPAC|nr:hypothetical protein [Peptoclostridium acidaminophilum]AHM56104.1 hypothetical protein EAL2_c08040 [Peptoclostridium acidaminophilum DSM 3953]AHM57078.1 hypothetical protein EAL2_c17860 [Peptoclostridium acidaminophilum DSM 3953]AHM57649.1 hypothetical protein EAL2_808p01440 [Peptoclostridium acidaminophilum DSM 3953]AHM57952.1 hypothetical protein EAL2_808p04490 [Peptoclostridium acidaminophilum DSM 3953]
MKGIRMMKVGPSTGIEQANLSNNLNAAVIKSRGSERLRKRLHKQSCEICEDERK